MEAKKLMIGDYVSYIDTFGERRIGKVTDLHHNESWETINVDFCDQNPERKSKITSVRPIPLTEEILEKNGFTDVGDCIYQNEEQCCGVELNTFMFYVYENDYDNDNCHDVAQVFDVHQLQHALRLVGLTELADNLKV